MCVVTAAVLQVSGRQGLRRFGQLKVLRKLQPAGAKGWETLAVSAQALGRALPAAGASGDGVAVGPQTIA